jgi:hypothetical protein
VFIGSAILLSGTASKGQSSSKFNQPGNILINDQVIEVTHATPSQIVASYGTINDPGFSPSTAMQMKAPYSAYVIGDYTGIRPPF